MLLPFTQIITPYGKILQAAMRRGGVTISVPTLFFWERPLMAFFSLLVEKDLKAPLSQKKKPKDPFSPEKKKTTSPLTALAS